MNVNIAEAYYVHTVGVSPPAYRLFSDWTTTAALIFETFSRHGSEPDDIRWETGKTQLSEYNVMCGLRGTLSGHVKFSPLAVELFLSISNLPATDIPALLEDALGVLRKLDPRLTLTNHRVVIGAHVGLIDDTFVALMARHLSLPPSDKALHPRSLVLTFDLPNDKKGAIDLQPSLKFDDPRFFFGSVACNWSSELDVRQAHQQSVVVTGEYAKLLGLDIAAQGVDA